MTEGAGQAPSLETLPFPKKIAAADRHPSGASRALHLV